MSKHSSRSMQPRREENSLENDKKFTYHGKGKIEDMPEDKRREYEENKKHVEKIFRDAMDGNGIIIINAVGGEHKNEAALFINGTNPITTVGILAVTIERVRKVMQENIQGMIMEDSDTDSEPSKYIG